MTIEEVTKNENVDFTGIPPSYYEGDKLETVFCNYMYKYV